MLKFRRVEISNFVCFDNITLEPSIDPEKPLTVVRAENGSGKTTLLRAIRWGMYGERGLPSPANEFGMQPAWWTPDKKGITTEVSIEFETDGSDRFSEAGTTRNATYLLRRSVTTIATQVNKKLHPNFRRINEQTRLMLKEADGKWKPHAAGVDLVVEQLLPWELRDFFVMDADEVTDYVGGIEIKTMHRKEVIAKTTAAVNGLLGIDVFKQAKERIDKIGKQFGRQAIKAVGNQALNELQSELDSLRFEKDELVKKIQTQSIHRDELEDTLQDRRVELETELKGIGANEELSIRLTKSREQQKSLTDRRIFVITQLASQVESSELLTGLSHKYISKSYSILKPLYDKGYIPAKHLHYVQSLLETGICVCGQDISQDNEFRSKVQEQISVSSEGKEKANYLGQVFDATRTLMENATNDIWDKQRSNLAKDIIEIDSDLAKLAIEIEDIKRKLDLIDEEKIQLIRNEISSLESQVENIKRRLAGDEARLPDLTKTIESLEKQIGQGQRGERMARDKREAESVAKVIVEVLDKACGVIQSEQVHHLSKKMDELFSQMVFNVTNEDLEYEPDKADVRMIAQVGIQSVDDRPDDYEIFAHNNLGNNMPPIAINGASRRVLALSFVLALCVESKTFAPLIADSLLNAMAGAVRHNTLLITAQTSNQPILLLTSANLGQPEMDIVDRLAGATYTLTAQWNAVDAGSGGDVVRWNDQRLVSLICNCSPRRYCDICERTGWTDSSILSKQERKE